MSISILYGSCVKVFTGRYYDSRRNKYKKNKSIEEQLLEALKSKNIPVIPYIRTETSKYGFIKLSSPNARDLLNKIKLPATSKSKVVLNKLKLVSTAKSKTNNNKIKLPPIKTQIKIIPE